MEIKKVDKNNIFKIVVSIAVGINLVLTGILLAFQIKRNIEESSRMTKYTLYIGTNDKDTYKQEIKYDVCVTKVRDICVKYASGCTLFDATGYWTDEKSNITEEKTIGCILEDIVLDTVYKICDDVLVALNQNSILIETDNVSAQFYSGKK